MKLPAKEGPSTSRSTASALYQEKVSSVCKKLNMTISTCVRLKSNLNGGEFTLVSPPQESSYVFREGMLPPHRQMFYQLCDLDVERYDHSTHPTIYMGVPVFSSAREGCWKTL